MALDLENIEELLRYFYFSEKVEKCRKRKRKCLGNSRLPQKKLTKK